MEKIREYIYLDIDRIKSIFSQMEEGLLIEKTEGSEKEGGVKGNVGSGILAELLLDVGIEGNVLYTKKQDETKILHDYMYNLLEKRMKDEGDLIEIPKNFSKDNYRNGLKSDSFILLKCRIRIEDYSMISDILRDINNLQIALELFGLNSMADGSNIDQWGEVEEKLKQNSQLLDKSYLKALSVFVNKFYDKKIFIKCMPFEEDIFWNFIGIMKEKYFREDIEDIIFKYGSFPEFEWYVFGQITSIPNKYNENTLDIKDSKYKIIKENWNEISNILNESEFFKQLKSDSKEYWGKLGLNKNDFIILKGKVLELSFEGLFDVINSLSYETSIKYPSIKFTPIAVYKTLSKTLLIFKILFAIVIPNEISAIDSF